MIVTNIELVNSAGKTCFPNDIGSFEIKNKLTLGFDSKFVTEKLHTEFEQNVDKIITSRGLLLLHTSTLLSLSNTHIANFIRSF